MLSRHREQHRTPKLRGALTMSKLCLGHFFFPPLPDWFLPSIHWWCLDLYPICISSSHFCPPSSRLISNWLLDTPIPIWILIGISNSKYPTENSRYLPLPPQNCSSSSLRHLRKWLHYLPTYSSQSSSSYSSFFFLLFPSSTSVMFDIPHS